MSIKRQEVDSDSLFITITRLRRQKCVAHSIHVLVFGFSEQTNNRPSAIYVCMYIFNGADGNRTSTTDAI